MRRNWFRRIRLTIRAMMALIAATAVLFFLILPLVQCGKPCCLTPARTALWLLTSPGKASCTNCHATRDASDSRRTALAMKTAPASCPLVRSASASRSCTACHTNPRSALENFPKISASAIVNPARRVRDLSLPSKQ